MPAFNNKKYLELQAQKISERISKFNNKLYLEFGGKIFDDYHASRVLPGFASDSKVKMLLGLKDKVEIIITINAKDIQTSKMRGDHGISYEDEVQKELAEKLYNDLKKQKVEVVLDDRLQKPGFKLKDWELIGVPYIIVVGRRAGEDIVEFKVRKENTKEEVTSTDAISKVVEAVRNL